MKVSLNTFKHWLLIVGGSIGILFALFCILTQWKFVTVSTEGISVKEIYQGPKDTIIYCLNVPIDRYTSTWEVEIKEDGTAYQIPKRSIIELHKNVVKSRLNDDIHYNNLGEMNHAQLVTGGPAITSWYIGTQDSAVLIWKEGMELEPAPYEILRECGIHTMVE